MFDDFKNADCYMDGENKKAIRLNSISRLKVTSASQTKGNAKIIINNEIAISKLKKKNKAMLILDFLHIFCIFAQ